MGLTKLLPPTAVVLTVLLGGAVALCAPKLMLPQMIAQNEEEQYEDKFMQELSLTPEQTQKVQSIRSQYKAQMVQSHQSLIQARHELQDLMVSSASTDQVLEKHHQLEVLQQQFGDQALEQQLAIREVLSPEQRRQVADLKKKQQENFKPLLRPLIEQQQ